MVFPPSDPAGSGLWSQPDHAFTFSLGSIVFEMSQMLCCCSHVICCLSSCSCGVKMHLAAQSRLALSAERSWESAGRWSGHRGGGMTAAIQWKEDIWIMPSLEETACVISSLFFLHLWKHAENMQIFPPSNRNVWTLIVYYIIFDTSVSLSWEKGLLNNTLWMFNII